MHECPWCGQACDCDMDDTWFDEAPLDCACECGGEMGVNGEEGQDDEDHD